MAKTIMITGASTGIGRATALYFKDKGWNVAATMRTPERAEGLSEGPKLKLYRLDVLDEASIDQAMAAAIGDFGKIDVILNNAGYGAMGPIEAATKSQVERQFDTNVVGLISVMQRFITLFRDQRGGTIINVSSMGGRMTFPLYSLYHGTKWAVEGITEGLVYELEQFGIRMRLIEPGAIATDFTDRSRDLLQRPGLTAYDTYIQRFENLIGEAISDAAEPIEAAKVIYKAATDKSDRLRYMVGKDAKFYWRLRRIFGDNIVMNNIRKRMKG